LGFSLVFVIHPPPPPPPPAWYRSIVVFSLPLYFWASSQSAKLSNASWEQNNKSKRHLLVLIAYCTLTWSLIWPCARTHDVYAHVVIILSSLWVASRLTSSTWPHARKKNAADRKSERGTTVLGTCTVARILQRQPGEPHATNGPIIPGSI
jgi:hypothetical protein